MSSALHQIRAFLILSGMFFYPDTFTSFCVDLGAMIWAALMLAGWGRLSGLELLLAWFAVVLTITCLALYGHYQSNKLASQVEQPE